MTIAAPLRKRGNSSTKVRSEKKSCLTNATSTAAVVVTEENKLDVTKGAESLRLSSEAVTTQESLLLAMQIVCAVCTEDFRNLQEVHDPQGGEDLGKSVDALLRDLPYNVRR